jgi:hypothetical protein
MTGSQQQAHTNYSPVEGEGRKCQPSSETSEHPQIDACSAVTRPNTISAGPRHTTYWVAPTQFASECRSSPVPGWRVGLVCVIHASSASQASFIALSDPFHKYRKPPGGPSGPSELEGGPEGSSYNLITRPGSTIRIRETNHSASGAGTDRLREWQQHPPEPRLRSIRSARDRFQR